MLLSSNYSSVCTSHPIPGHAGQVRKGDNRERIEYPGSPGTAGVLVPAYSSADGYQQGEEEEQGRAEWWHHPVLWCVLTGVQTYTGLCVFYSQPVLGGYAW